MEPGARDHQLTAADWTAIAAWVAVVGTAFLVFITYNQLPRISDKWSIKKKDYEKIQKENKLHKEQFKAVWAWAYDPGDTGKCKAERLELFTWWEGIVFGSGEGRKGDGTDGDQDYESYLVWLDMRINPHGRMSPRGGGSWPDSPCREHLAGPQVLAARSPAEQ
jgi:hypothetical protein